MSHDEKLNKNDSTYVRNHETQGGVHSSDTTSEQANPAASLQRMMVSGSRTNPNDVIALQRTIGNQAVQRVIQRFTVTAANNPNEKDADLHAEQMAAEMNAPAQRSAVEEEGQLQRNVDEEEGQLKRVQRNVDEEEGQLKRVQRNVDEEEGQLMRVQRAVGLEGGAAPAEAEEMINSTRGGGSALPDNIRSTAESHFGQDFSSVRVHTGDTAESINRSLGATAATVGTDIYMSNKADTKTMLHEISHVPQTENLPQIQNKRVQRNVEDEEGQLKRVQRNPQEEDKLNLKRVQRDVTEEEEVG